VTQTFPRQRSVGRDVENADQLFRAVVDVEQPVVRRQAKAVRLLEQIAIDHELGTVAIGRHAIDGLKTEFARPLDAKDGDAPVVGVGEINRAVGAHANVIRAVQFLPLEMAREHLTCSVRPLADEQ
jgi:hypothetical protein